MDDATYIVRVTNRALGTRHFEGTWNEQGRAEEHARVKAARSRSFASYQVWTGAPRRPGRAAGPEIQGHADGE